MNRRDTGNGPVHDPADDTGPARPGEADEGTGAGAGQGDSDANVAVEAMLADLEATLENTRAELGRKNDQLLRIAAEFDNYRKRTERERTELWSRAQADLASKLLEPLDDLERVILHEPEGSNTPLIEGVKLVDKKLRTVLANAGLERVEADGAAFDPNCMEAVATVQVENRDEEGMVSDVFQPGYTFKGQLLRPARVRVKQYEG